MSIRDISIEYASEEFRRWRQATGYAKSTTNNDRMAINFLIKATSPDKVLKYVDSRHAAAALEIAGRTRNASAINGVQASLSAFFKWARANRYMRIDNDPLLGIRYQKVRKVEQDRLLIHEFKPFLDSAESPRDRAFCAIGLYLFPRASEAVSLQIKDVNLQSGTIAVTVHKTKDFDLMPISAELDRELRGWLKDYQETAGQLHPNWYLFPAMKQGRAFDDWVLAPENKISVPASIVRKTAARYGVENLDRCGMHLLRRSGARAFFDELDSQSIDGALRMTQAMLHHASVTMTEKYLGITVDRVKRDRIVQGNSMFPSLEDKNVVELRGYHLAEANG